MPQFTYTAVREDGTSITEEASAPDADELRRELSARGYLVLGLQKKRVRLTSGKGDPKDFLLFNQEFSTLIKAGLPILQALEILKRRTEKHGFQNALDGIIHEIKGGTLLSDAMAMHPAYFSLLYTATVRAGEKSGALVDVLRRFIEYQKRIIAIRRKLITAMIYPSIVVTFLLAIMTLFFFYIIPSFTNMYSAQEGELPFLTTLLLTVSERLVSYVPLLILGSIVAGTGIYLWKKTERGKIILDKIKIKLPIIGSLIIQYTLAQLTRTLSTVLRGGIPLVQAMDTTASATKNRVLTKGLQEAQKLVTEGVSLANAFERTKIAPEMTIRMIEVGESSGDLPQMLEDVADFYEDDADSKIPVLTTIIEVILILFLGIVIGVIVIALYLPIFEMGAQIR